MEVCGVFWQSAFEAGASEARAVPCFGITLQWFAGGVHQQHTTSSSDSATTWWFLVLGLQHSCLSPMRFLLGPEQAEWGFPEVTVSLSVILDRLVM